MFRHVIKFIIHHSFLLVVFIFEFGHFIMSDLPFLCIVASSLKSNFQKRPSKKNEEEKKLQFSILLLLYCIASINTRPPTWRVRDKNQRMSQFLILVKILFTNIQFYKFNAAYEHLTPRNHHMFKKNAPSHLDIALSLNAKKEAKMSCKLQLLSLSVNIWIAFISSSKFIFLFQPHHEIVSFFLV